MAAKMKFYGINGKILSLLSDLYKGTIGHFNLYMNDLCSELLQKSSIIDSPAFNFQIQIIPCLLWADDLVLMSCKNQKRST